MYIENGQISSLFAKSLEEEGIIAQYTMSRTPQRIVNL
jgi:hypothetical protein